MRIRIAIPSLVIVVFFLLWNPLEPIACSCVMPPPPEDALNDSHAVFSGEVIDVVDNKGIINGYGKSIYFKVDKSWKGIDQAEVRVTTGNNDGDCGIPFEKGQTYLVYATASDMYVKNTLSTTICHRTMELSDATEDLNALGEGKVIVAGEEKGTTVKKDSFNWVLVGFILSSLAVLVILMLYFKKKK